MKPYHSIFREEAIAEYIQRQETDTLPQFVSPVIFIIAYILLGLLLCSGLAVLWGEVPLYVPGSGVILTEGAARGLEHSKTVVILFVPAKYARQIPIGASIQVNVKTTRQPLTGTIKRIGDKVISPDEARRRYMLHNPSAQVPAQFSVAVLIKPARADIPRAQTGDPVSAQVQVGSRRILSLFLPFTD